MKQLIKSRAPLRISFIGGGTDVSPFPETYGGIVINATISKYVHATLRFDKESVKHNDIVRAVMKELHFDIDDDGFSVDIKSDVASCSGLGGSSAVFVAVIGLFNELLEPSTSMDNYQIAELAYKLERDELKNIGGRQDQYATAFGGTNMIEFWGDNHVRLTPLKLKQETILELEDRLVLLDLGARKASGNIIKDQIKNIKKKGIELAAMLSTKAMVKAMEYMLLEGKIIEFGEMLDEAWRFKKSFSNMITNPEIDKLYDDLKKVGVIGGKISGAGGGGHMFVLCKAFTKDKVEEVAKEWGAEIVPFKFEDSGLVVWRSNF